MPGKKMVLLAVIVAIRAFAVQAKLDFPIKDLITGNVTDQAKVVAISERTCVLTGSDQHPLP
jgi:hypothetical protein